MTILEGHVLLMLWGAIGALQLIMLVGRDRYILKRWYDWRTMYIMLFMVPSLIIWWPLVSYMWITEGFNGKNSQVSSDSRGRRAV